MEDISKMPSIKIVLFGPTGSGKTTFMHVLLNGQAPSEEIPQTTSVQVNEVVRQYQKRIANRFVPTETYRLIIADTPGIPEAKGERRKGLQKSVGIIFFYDATSPQSPRELLNMIQEEIIKLELYYNLMGILVVGTKKDLGVNSEAISSGEEVTKALNSLVENLWGYKVPHLVISAKSPEEVGWAIYILESIIMDKPPLDIIQKLSASNISGAPILEQLPSQPTVQKTEQITRPQPYVAETKQASLKGEQESIEAIPKQVEEQLIQRTPVREIGETQSIASEQIKTPPIGQPKHELDFEGYKIRLNPSDKIWITLEKLATSRPEQIKEVIFIRKAGEVLYVAFYPGEKVLDSVKKDVVIRSIEIEKLGDKMAMEYNVENPQMFMIKGQKESVMVIKRREALLIVKTKGLPSEELIKLLV